VSDPFDARQMFVGDMGLGYRAVGDTSLGQITPSDELRRPDGGIRVSVLATASDVVAGALANRTIGPRIPLTVDLTVHALLRAHAETVDVVARLVKVGRSTVVAEAWFSGDESERPFGLSQLTFSPSPKVEHTIEVQGDRPATPPNFTEPWFEQLGIRVLGPGIAEVDRWPYVMQPSGTIQGGAVAALIEAAAESLTGRAVTDIDIRYLKAVRVGPGRAVATPLDAGLVRVEVRDPGNEDRVASIAIARCPV
jgi:acyl-coenzyme A thioesterase PaaI-like protein